jgi:peptidoglycan hydrolase-like protein with peptidoglycan-binding domain
MFLASKVVWTGVALTLLAAGISGPRPAKFASEPNLIEGAPAVRHQDGVKKIQETLRDKGHYRGKVDGVFGLRTQASIRAYQKAENLPITGQVDTRTADGLGVTSESREKSIYETTKGKPSAGIKWAKGPRRKNSEAGRRDREKAVQTENDSDTHPQ